MVTFTDEQKALIVEQLVENGLRSLELDFPEDGEAQARRRLLLLRIVASLYADDLTNPTLERLLEEHNIIHHHRPIEATELIEPAQLTEPAEVDVGATVDDEVADLDGQAGAVVISDDEEEEEAEAEVYEPQEVPFFRPNVMYRSTLAMVGNQLVAVGYGYSANNANGSRFYTAGTTRNRYDMNQPPPRACFNCDGNHWRSDCPYAHGNSTV